MQLHFPPDAQSQSAFDAQAFLARLATQTLGSTILTTAELPSTQTLLHDNASIIPDGTVCVADRQVTGKGDLAHTPTMLTLMLLQSSAQSYWQCCLNGRYDHIASRYYRRMRRAWAQYMAFVSWLLDVFTIDAH